MRRGLRGRPAALAALLATLLTSQTTPAHAADRGVIEGVVINETTGARGAGVEITLTAANADGSDRMQETVVADRRGRYRFADLPTGDDRFYVIDARYDGGLFPGSPVTLPGGTAEPPVIETAIKVWNTTDDPNTLLIARDDLFVSAGEGALDVIESVTVANMTQHAYIGRGEAGAPTLGLAVPGPARGSGVEILDSELDVPELLQADFGVGLTIAIPPGEWRFTYAYRVPGAAGTHELSRTALYPIVRANVHAADGIEIESNRLVEAGAVTIGGTEYRKWSSARAIEAGDQLQVAATVTGGSMSSALVLGAALALVALAGMGLVFALRRKAGRATTPDDGPSPRDELLTAIAALDIRHERGEIDENEYAARRAELKARVTGGEPERIP